MGHNDYKNLLLVKTEVATGVSISEKLLWMSKGEDMGGTGTLTVQCLGGGPLWLQGGVPPSHTTLSCLQKRGDKI